MLVKFFKGKHNNPQHAINYLLNKKRIENGTATLLTEYNTPQQIKLFYKNLDKNKYKSNIYTSGVISFSREETKHLTEQQIKTIIEEFLNTLNPGIPHHNYLKLFVKHTDKNRLEYHFVIPNFIFNENKIMKKTMYYDKVDKQKFYYFERYINKKFNLDDPLQKTKPAKLSFNTYEKYKKEIENSKTKKEVKDKLHKLLLQKIKNDEIKNKNELINFIKNTLNYKITRQGKDYISILIPGQKKSIRFKNIIYSEQFTSKKAIINEIKEIRETIENEDNIEKQLQKILEKQIKNNNKRFNFIISSEKEKEKNVLNVKNNNKPDQFKGNDMNFKELAQFLKENLLIKDYLDTSENITNSPLREDLNPSFFITKYNTWIDLATGDRGDIFDLIGEMEHITDFKNQVLRAKEIYIDMYGEIPENYEKNTTQTDNRIQQKTVKTIKNVTEKKKESSLKIIEKTTPNDFNLLNYFIQERGIDKAILKNFTEQLTIYNEKTNKYFKAIGFKNLGGGYEIRNKLFKGSVGKKHISIRNYKESNKNILILEGFTDFLSLLTILNNDNYIKTNYNFITMFEKLETISFIILNSIVNIEKIRPFIRNKKIFTLLDNDNPGQEAANKISQLYSNEVVGIRNLTKEILTEREKDINDYLLRIKQEAEQKEREQQKQNNIIYTNEYDYITLS